MHADTDAGGYPHDHFPGPDVLLGVMELMRARGLLGGLPATGSTGQVDPGQGAERGIEQSCPVGAPTAQALPVARS